VRIVSHVFGFLLILVPLSAQSAVFAPVRTQVCTPIPTPTGPLATSYIEDIGSKFSNFITPSDKFRDACIGRVNTALGPLHIENITVSEYCANDTIKVSREGRDRCRLKDGTLEKMQAQLTQKCFGALGAECGQQLSLLGLVNTGINTGALCGGSPHKCFVNSGSIKHDECCFANYKSNLEKYRAGLPITLARGCANGFFDDLPFATSNQCASSWEEAKSHVTQTRNWERVVDPAKTNTTGTVVREDYYATRGTRLHRDDAEYCLSGHRLLNPFTERAERFGAFEVICN
jgi:hypothetical protein